MTTGRRVKHLWECALTLDTETHMKKLLKSNLINNCRQLAGTNPSIPLERFTESQMCTRCSLHWQENEFHAKLKSQGLQITTNKAKRLIEKLKVQEGSDQRLLTKKQKNRAKWLRKKAESKLEIHCEFCKHKTVIALDKSTKSKPAQKVKPAEKALPVEFAQSNKKKKKTKNKDKTAGLKIPTQKIGIQKTLDTKKTEEPKTAFTPKLKQSTVEPINKKQQTANSFNKLSKPKSVNPKQAPKFQSKTQKQNSLLQLAALLKSQQNSKPASNKNLLDSFLK